MSKAKPPARELCYCGKHATVFRTADGAKWCEKCSPYAKYDARCPFQFPTGDRCEGKAYEDHEHWLANSP